MSIAFTDLQEPVSSDAKCYDCPKIVTYYEDPVYWMDKNGITHTLCRECGENRRRAAAARITEAEHE